jgi:hypothetical protein
VLSLGVVLESQPDQVMATKLDEQKLDSGQLNIEGCRKRRKNVKIHSISASTGPAVELMVPPQHLSGLVVTPFLYTDTTRPKL